jgi:hypothetical protein
LPQLVAWTAPAAFRSLYQAVYGNKSWILPGKLNYQVDQQAGKRTALVRKNKLPASTSLLPGTETLRAFQGRWAKPTLGKMQISIVLTVDLGKPHFKMHQQGDRSGSQRIWQRKMTTHGLTANAWRDISWRFAFSAFVARAYGNHPDTL